MEQTQYQNMTDNHLQEMYPQEGTLKLASSASDQNVFFTYVCLVNDPNANNLPNHRPSYGYIDGDLEEVDQEEPPIKVERSKALHELVESHRHELDIEDNKYKANEASTAHQTLTSIDESDASENEHVINFDTANPNVLKLTKMKWLTEEQEDSPNSSSPSVSSVASSTSTCSREAEDHVSQTSVGDKYLSTILRLDREHNMFGLSNIAIVGSKPSKKMKKESVKPVFPQTAIVQVCCGQDCCRHRSKTDLPSSLKCGGCRSCCADPVCPVCMNKPCDPPCCDPSPCPQLCPSCPKGSCTCKCQLTCPPSKCFLDCSYGLKPFAARSCHHLPRCIPPSSCFPYLMPCFWPARPSAPCSVPARCFHNPPCRAPRKKRPPGSNMPESCPPGTCATKGTPCPNMLCPGKIPQLQQELESKFTK